MIRHVFLIAIAGFILANNSVARVQTTGPPKFKIDYGFEFPISGKGVAPIRVRMSRQPAIPLGYDQQFNVVISENWKTNGRSSKTVSSALIIPAGQTSAEVVLYVQCHNIYESRLLIENGQGNSDYGPDDLLRTDISPRSNGARIRNSDSSWLIVSSSAKNANPSYQITVSKSNARYQKFSVGASVIATDSNWAKNIAQTPGLKTIFGSSPIDLSRGDSNWHAVPPSDLPETWVGLSSIDYMLIESTELESLCESNAYRELLENWVGAGGSLVVFNSKKSLAHASRIFTALLGHNQFEKPVQWTVQNERAFKSTSRMTVPTRSSNRSRFPTKLTHELSAKDLVATRSYLRGEVIAIVSPDSLGQKISVDSFPSKRQIGKSIFQIQESNQMSAVPGVGSPPITLFAIATGLFLFLIGPVILVVVSLNNDRRHYFYAVPITSFITCSCILSYAVIADFNKQWARTETVMTLDQKSGRAFIEATSAYYCGNQPSYYAFDYETMFATAFDGSNGYKIRQLEKETRLSGPKIQPRRTHEVYAAKPVSTEQRFVVSTPEGDAATPQVTNLLGGRIAIAGFEYQRKYYLVRNVEHQQTATAERLVQTECRTQIGKFIRKQRLAGGSPFFTDRVNQNVAIQLDNAGEFAAVLETNPATAEIIQPFEIKLQTHIVHGRY